MAAPLDSVHPERARRLADPALHQSVRNFVRGRVPAEDVDDVVQTTLTDALAAADAPTAPEEFRRWVFGIAHNKIADLFRRRKRGAEQSEPPDMAAPSEASPLEGRELLQWVDREVPSNDGARSTLEWMLREGDGDSLEEIAKEQRLPAPRVRQRVSRLRRHLRSRWAVLSAGLGLALVLGAAWFLLRRTSDQAPERIIVREEPKEPSPAERARPIRELAFEQCNKGQFRECLEALDRAKVIDPIGDADNRVQGARAGAAKALEPEPQIPAPKPSPTNSSDLDSLMKAPPQKAAPAKRAPTKVRPKVQSNSDFNIDPSQEFNPKQQLNRKDFEPQDKK